MTPGQFERVKELFDRALHVPTDARDAFLVQATDDKEVRAEVILLLNQETHDGGIEIIRGAIGEALRSSSPAELRQDAGEITRKSVSETPALFEGTRSGPGLAGVDALVPFRILRKVGEGGMGVVYEAEQEQPVHRRVALKLIKWGMDTQQVIARFESERQALALMNHPNIASVYEAGATTEGRPYFAMELVEGIPVTKYCDEHRLPVRERLELFIQICEGVQHAHQKGIIHRDLKPSNILVTRHDDSTVPKIIDFGIAKATSQRLTERSVHTELGQLIGTPEYMSPEQADMSTFDVDTRTDVYSLGVLLYELLVGALPFEQALQDASFDELRRQIREEDPLRPSTRARNLADRTPKIAEARRTDVSGLSRQLRGDLDWIVMKALAKEPDRRYETANALALDVRRHLDHEPVRARKPGAPYLMAKFIRRHRMGVAAGALVTLAILAGSALAVTGLVRARAAERQANAQAAKVLAINGFLQDVLGSADPVLGQGRDVTILEALAHAVDSVDEAFADQPELQGAVLDTVGRTYLSLGRYSESRAVLTRALDLRRTALGNDSLDVAESLTSLGALLFADGDYAAAEPRFREALAIRREAYGNEHATVAESINDIAMTLQRKSQDYAAAEPLLIESLAIRRRLHGETHPDIAQSLNNLAMLYYRMQAFERAEPLFREAIAMNRELFGDEHVELSTNLNNLGLLMREKGDTDAAFELFQQVLEMDRKLLGPHHPYVAATLRRLGRLRSDSGDDAEAESLYREALRVQAHSFADDHWELAWTKSLLGESLSRLGRLEAAEELLNESLVILESELGERHPFTRQTLEHLVNLYERKNDEQKASELSHRLEALEGERP